MVEAVGGAQISVNGGGGAGDGTRRTEKKLLQFFTFYEFLLAKNMI
jgi:hypothetical protein